MTSQWESDRAHEGRAKEMWTEAWPEVPWSEASPTDQMLYLDHAASVIFWEETNS